jgi:hypothetical protein
VLPYEPLPDEALAQPKPVNVDAVEDSAGVPGTADFDVAKDVAGAEVTRAPTMIESPIAYPEGNVKVAVRDPCTPARSAPSETTEMIDGVRSTAVAGATEESVPKPKAATATSAMRLKVVFVDICFLSISRSEEFPPLGFG